MFTLGFMLFALMLVIGIGFAVIASIKFVGDARTGGVQSSIHNNGPAVVAPLLLVIAAFFGADWARRRRREEKQRKLAEKRGG